MRVTETIPIDAQHSIEFGIATWCQDRPKDEQVESIRNRYENEDGIFSPRGSSEIPLTDMEILVCECLKRDKLNIDEMSNILKEIAESIKRQIV